MTGMGARSQTRNRGPLGSALRTLRIRGAWGGEPQRGMTIPELLVAISILAILFGLLFLPLLKAFGYMHTTNVRMDVQDSARTAFETLVREVSDATEIYDNRNDATLSSLCLVLPRTLASPTNPVYVQWFVGLSVADQPYRNTLETENAVQSSVVLDTDNGVAELMTPGNDVGYVLFRAQETATPGNPAIYVMDQATGLPAVLDDSRRQMATALLNTTGTGSPVDRRGYLERSTNPDVLGITALTPTARADVAWPSLVRVENPPGTFTAMWSVKPGLHFEAKAARDEPLDPVSTGGSAYRAPNGIAYASLFQADHGHWQTIRDASGGGSYGVRAGQYYTAMGAGDDYYVMLTGSPTPVFNISYYLEQLAAGSPDRYPAALLPSPTDPVLPYWPGMAFLVDPIRGTVQFRVDAPVRAASATDPPGQPPAPFVVDGIQDTTEIEANWVIPDVDRVLRLRDASDPRYANYSHTRIAPETMRVMADDGSGWRTFTPSTTADVSPGQFTFDADTGTLSFDPTEAQGFTSIRAWYQLQTNVPDTASPGVEPVTASYYTKEVWKLSLSLRGYDTDTGKAIPFHLTATVRPRNLR